jgi:hypothetical protein
MPKKWTTTQCLSAKCDHPEHQPAKDVKIEQDEVTINAPGNKGTVIGRSDNETWKF